MAISDKYYLISAKYKSELASAYAPEGTKLAHELISDINGDEMPFEFTLVKVSSGKNGLIESTDLSGLNDVWLDYQPNSLAWPLMSSRLQSIINDSLTGYENIKWVKAKINSQDEQREYYIPKFSNKLDVLDEAKTMYVPGTDQIIKPSFSLAKVKELAIFHKPSSFWQITTEMYVSEKLKKAIQIDKLIGLDFEKTSVV